MEQSTTWLYRLVVNACQDAARRRKASAPAAKRSCLAELAIPGSQEDDLARAQMARSVRAAGLGFVFSAPLR
jgi:DNA-directed RNA polymerase specialized sigma24 family protein